MAQNKKQRLLWGLGLLGTAVFTLLMGWLHYQQLLSTGYYYSDIPAHMAGHAMGNTGFSLVTVLLRGVFAIGGLLAGLVGVILASRVLSSQPNAGVGYESDAIAAAIIGGTSPSGGSGTILGTVIGALTIAVLKNGLNLLQVNPFWQQIAIGIVIIVAVFIDNLRKKNNKK